MQDIVETCKDCGQEFKISIGDQEFFKSKQDEFGQPLSFPKRCKDCRWKIKSGNGDKFRKAVEEGTNKYPGSKHIH